MFKILKLNLLKKWNQLVGYIKIKTLKTQQKIIKHKLMISMT
jgi:hypothetical protein